MADLGCNGHEGRSSTGSERGTCPEPVDTCPEPVDTCPEPVEGARRGRTAGRLPALPRPIGVGVGAKAIAHRGEPVGFRENTLPALTAALAAPADLIEIDVKVTADGQVVLLHDDTLERLWGHPGEIRRLELADLTALAGDGVRIPLLSEALELLAGSGTALLIDMDSAEWATPSQRVVEQAITAGRLDRSEIVWCGRTESLQVIREADPDARIVLSWDEGNGNGGPPTDAVVDLLAPEAYNPHWPMMTGEVIDWARERQLATCCWTVDDAALMHQLLDLGVDALISNQIGTLRKVLDDRSR